MRTNTGIGGGRIDAGTILLNLQFFGDMLHMDGSVGYQGPGAMTAR